MRRVTLTKEPSRARCLAVAATIAVAMAVGSAHAQTKGGPTPSPPGAAVYFIGIKDGDTLPTKATIHFGLHNMSVAPAGVDRENSGHHHLIVDAPLPPLDKPIPNDFNHLHFGAGQTEAQVDLTPGKHTLQLLLGDKDHIPHTPPLFSERITVNVADTAHGASTAQRHTSPAGAEVYFENLRDGQYIPTHMIARFGLLNMGVAPAGVDKPNTGHHHLVIDAPPPSPDRPIPNDFNHLHFGAGQTQAEITLTPGRHSLQLVLGDENHFLHEPPVMSKPITVVVGDPDQRPVMRRGTSGPSVAAMQALLGIAADGAFGPATEQAIIEFQRRTNLNADAVVGPATWKALDDLSDSKAQ
jgi:peptidoglycan hydrolase-like protein with peptidoglycan-binding domain